MIASRRRDFFKDRFTDIHSSGWRPATRGEPSANGWAATRDPGLAGSVAGWWQADADHDVFSFSATQGFWRATNFTHFKHQNSYCLCHPVSEGDTVIQSPMLSHNTLCVDHCNAEGQQNVIPTAINPSIRWHQQYCDVFLCMCLCF